MGSPSFHHCFSVIEDTITFEGTILWPLFIIKFSPTNMPRQVLKIKKCFVMKRSRNVGLFYLTFFASEQLLQPFGVWESFLVPGEVPFALSVLYVQPHDIIRNVMFIESCIHCFYILFIFVVPAALMVSQGEERGHGLCA